MSRGNCYTVVYTKGRSKGVDYDKIKPYLRAKSQMITTRLNPDLLHLLDETLKKDKNYTNRNEFIEDCILRYLDGKGKL